MVEVLRLTVDPAACDPAFRLVPCDTFLPPADETPFASGDPARPAMTLLSAFEVTVLKEAICVSGLNCLEAVSQSTCLSIHR
jgi:hypothetical protein